MKIAILVVAAVFVVVIDIVLRLIVRREHKHFDDLSPDEQRKYQESLHEVQSYFNS